MNKSFLSKQPNNKINRPYKRINKAPKIITVTKLRSINLFKTETIKRGIIEARKILIIFLLSGTKERKYFIWKR